MTFIEYPLVSIKTKDNIPLYGLYLRAGGKSILIAIHGTASNFYENDFMKEITNLTSEHNISILLTNNRGADVLQAYPPHGAALEHFEDCIVDIDAWIEYVVSLGYQEIFLQGHSLGSEKVVHYMNKGKYPNKVVGLILLGFSDSWGAEMEYLNKKGVEEYFKEAEKLVKKGEGMEFLTFDWLCYSGVMPKSASSFLDFMKKDSELSKALPFHEGNLPLIRSIQVPILAVVGDQREYTVIPINEAVDLLKKENPRAEVYQLLNCNHDFEGKEKELAQLVGRFIQKIIMR